MSEVLRALLTQASTYRSPAFYSSAVQQVTTITGAKSFTKRTTQIVCKSDTWFLLMGAAQFSCFTQGPGTGNQGWAPKAEATTFQLHRGSNGMRFSNDRTIKSNVNSNLNAFATLSEYVLFKPSELIEISEDVQLTDVTFVLTRTTMVVLMGMEYKLPGS
jgi:hypothetical protein